ncbi:ATP-binding protein [Pleionea sp. CnH1-48]|uniref:hybrid sensor histidine kinase/response regulator transcription factor n=1 Tax=Pleionea sp. CnH1-48 TaxID=2954494 RepID=UPI0020970BCB|nr:ATP-binding protein [Pleionea sp. CnH1-48]MCO7224499.1 ATP-binding protein [Pleionea sp. CnH1-48]
MKVALLLLFCVVTSTGNTIELEKQLSEGLTEREKIVSYYQDSKGKLWAATENDILTFNGKIWQRLPGYDDESRIKKTFATDLIEWDESIWISTRERLIRYDRDSLDFFQFEHNRKNDKSLIRGEIWSLFVDNKNQLWLGSYYGISHYSQQDNQFLNYYFPDELIKQYDNNLNTALCFLDTDSYLYIVTVSGQLILFDKEKNTFSSASSRTLGQVFQCETQGQSLWIASEYGLWKFNGLSNQLTQVINPGKAVLSLLLVDKEILLSTHSNLLSYSISSKEMNIVSNLDAKSFFLDREKNIWATSKSGGILKHSPSVNKFELEAIDSDKKTLISHIIKLREETWIATNKGIKVVNKEASWLEKDKSFSLIYKGIDSVIAVSKQSVLWFDTITKDVVRQVKVDELKNKGLKVTSLVEDKTGRVWMALSSFDYSQLLRIGHNEKHFSEYDSNDPMYVKPFDWLHVSISPERDRLYVDTNANFPRIYDIDSNQFIRLKLADGLTLNTRKIQSTLTRQWTYHDDYRVTYFSWTGNGIPKISTIDLPRPGVECLASLDLENFWLVDRQGDLWHWTKSTDKLKRFSQHDGIPPSGLDGKYCRLDSQQQQLALSSSNFISTLNLSDLKENTIQPKVDFETVYVNRQPIKISAGHNIYANEGDDIEINGSNSSYAATEKNQWLWILSSDGVAHFTSTESQINLVNVREGQYKLSLRASNNDDMWSTDSQLSIVVAPPFWRSASAYALYSVLLLFLLTSYYFWTNYQRKKLSRLVKLKTQEISELLAQKERLFTGISHEFRTPLTLIQAGVENLQAILVPDVTDIANKLKHNAQHLLRLVEELLDFSLVKQAPTEESTIDVSEVTDSIALAFTELADSANIQLHTHLEPNLSIAISYNAYEKILSNLIHNGIKYNKQNGELAIYVSKTSQGYVGIRITDSGIGIPEEDLSRIFEPLYRVQEKSKNQIQGTGIGLALVKELVEKYHGTIEVKSTPKQGTSFCLQFPLAKQLYPSSHNSNEETLKKLNDKVSMSLEDVDDNQLIDIDIDSNSKNVALIVEDNPELRAFIIESVQEHFFVLSAANGVQALEVASEQIPDIIVSDIMMPSMDGFELLQRIRSNEITSHIPVILLTAKTDAQSRLKGWSETADDFMTKPFSSQELLLRMRSLLSLREMLKLRYQQTEPKRATEKATDIPSSLDPFLEKVNHILTQNYTEQSFKVPQLASECGLSERQIQRKIKAITGQSVSDFMRTFRLAKAHELLSNGTTVKEAALSTGFSSMPYFSKCFKSLYNISPSEVRQSSTPQ